MKVLIFGIKEMAELAHFYLQNDSHHTIEAFVVDGEFMPKEKTFCNLPIVAFEEVKQLFSPNEYNFFAPIYASKMNKIRTEVYNKIKLIGYNLISYISTKALIWNSKIGDNCFIFEGCNLQPFSSVGNNVIIWSFSHLGHHSKIEDNVFLSGNVVVAGKCIVEQFSFLGTNCSIREQTKISKGTLVAQDASIIKDTDAWGVYGGVPAKKINNNSLEAKI